MTEAPRKGPSLLAILIIACGVFAYIHWNHHPSLQGGREKAFLAGCTILVVGPAAVRRFTRKGNGEFDLAQNFIIPLGEVITAIGIAMAAHFLISLR